MRRRSRAGGEPVKRRRRNTAAPKRRNASKVARRRSSFAAGQETKVARLTRELNEALERQKATAEVLSAISRSKFELQSILQSVVDTASHLCGADASVIFRLEGGVYRFAAGYSLDPAYIEHERRTAISPGPGTVIGRAAMTRQVVRIEDAWTDPLYEQKTAAKISGGRSMIGVPLMREGEPIGAIGLARTRVDPFTQREIELVTTFAEQAVIAIENARLLSELRESLAQQTATADVLKVISRSAFDLNAVWRTLVESACTLCDAPQGLIELLDGDVYRLVMQKGYGEAFERYLVENPLRAGSSSGTGRAAGTGVVSHIPDVLQDPDYRLTEGQRLGGYRANLAVPLLREQKVIGVFVLARPTPGPFTPRQIALVQTFADQAVIAIENVRLFDDVQKRTAELTESLEQQTATADVLRVISSSPTDVQPVLDAIVRTAGELCASEYSIAFRLRDGKYHMAASNNAEVEWVKYWSEHPISVDRGSVVGRTALERRAVHIPDCPDRPRIRDARSGPPWEATLDARGPTAARRCADRRHCLAAHLGETIHRKADRVGDDLRRSGGDRHREHAAAERAS
jgi:GAF domain-containing protein